jgi:Xaa-Pro aminopeptidase
MWHGIYGYTIGLGFPPRWEDSTDIFIKRGYNNMLETNMVFHVSTTLRDLGKHSVTISETVAVTQTGCEVYTLAPRELYIKSGKI